MSDRQIFEEYEPEDRVLKLIKKSKESPFVPIGKDIERFLKENLK